MLRRQQAVDRAVPRAMRSPRAPRLQREIERLFWIEIAEGLLPTVATLYGACLCQELGVGSSTN
jgi:hypothetical protein